MNPRQMIAEGLRNGRRWKRSFHVFGRQLDAMIRDGEVHAVKPENGRGANMVELTGRGWKAYFGEDLLVSRLDNFAELLADGHDPQDVGRILNLTRGQVAAAVRDIKKHLGAQAA